MCDTQHYNASSSSTEERQRITNRIDSRISSLITPIDGNEHINLEISATDNYSFVKKLKRKHDNDNITTSVSSKSNKTPKQTVNKYFPVNIATLNVRGFNDDVKQHQILDYINLMHLDIVGLTELHVTNESFTKKQCFKSNESYDFYWAIDDNKQQVDTASGCCLALKKDFSKHIQKVQTFKGRLISIDLFFKRFNRIRIILVYVPPTKRLDLKKELALELTKCIDDGCRKKFKLVVMGDFNENMDSFLDQKLQGRSANTHVHRFLNIMNRFQLHNSLEHHSSTPFAHTWKNSTTQSRIDGIYISDSLLNESLMSFTDDSLRPNISDHACVINKFNRGLFFKPDKFFDTKSRTQTRSFQFHKMDPDKWKAYNKATKLALVMDADLTLLHTPSPPTIHYLNFLNDKLERILSECARQHVPTKIRKEESYNNLLPKDIVLVERYLKKCNRINRLLNKRNKHHVINNPNHKQWHNWLDLLPSVYNFLDESPSQWPEMVTSSNLKVCRDKLDNITRTLIRRTRSEYSKYDSQQIKFYTDRRCSDLRDNQSRMIDSLLERTHRKIKLDRVMLDDGSLTTDEQEINNKVNDHFQNVAKPRDHAPTDIPDEWLPYYAPINIEDSVYNSQLNPIEMDEFNGIVNHCPNGKAAGVSGITYELVKYASKEFKQWLLKLYNGCIVAGITPTSWKYALLYPIPKPMEWECDINKTRPIVLLEIFRKIFSKVITKRLSHTLVSNKILKGNNHAGLPGGSTLEPIRILNMIMEDAATNRKPLYIYFQDMSKAYDRVRLPILKRALERLRIPSKLIDIIIGLFSDRENSVITNSGFTDPYNIITGIDQGEIISPLLWVIYYDPLLTRLQGMTPRYTISARSTTNIYEESSTESVSYSTSAFLDDTELISDNIPSMSDKLTVCASFFDFTCIEANPDKAVMITNDTSNVDKDGFLKIIINGSEHKIKVSKQGRLERFLGVFINFGNNNKTLHSMLRSIIYNATVTLHKKRLTVDHLRYLFNHVLIPKLEYIMQIRIFSKRDSDKIINPYKALVRHKVNIASSTPSLLLHAPLAIGIKDLYTHQQSVQLDALNIQLSDKGLLGHVSYVQILQLRNKYSCSSNPLQIVRRLDRLYHTMTLMEKTIIITRDWPLTFHYNRLKPIHGGDIELINLVNPRRLIKDGKLLNKLNLVFLNQIINSNMNLLTWDEIRLLIPSCSPRCMRWYNDIKAVVADSSLTLFQPFRTYSNLRCISTDLSGMNSNKSHQPFLAAWHPTSAIIVIGKRIKNKNNQLTSIRHHIIKNQTATYIETLECEYCQLATDDSTSRKGCIIDFTHKIFTKLKQASKEFKRDNNLNSSSYVLLTNEARIISGLATCYDLFRDVRLLPPTVSNSILDIFIPSPALTALYSATNSFANSKQLEFYTDGSLSNLSSKNMSMGIGWIQTNNSAPNVEFFARITEWPSSTRAEIMAILSALITCPNSCDVTIFTDSQCSIDTFKRVTSPFITNRRLEKIGNRALWHSIKYVIDHLLLSVSLRKVKGHSDNFFNNRADLLAKQGGSSNILLKLNSNNTTFPSTFAIAWNSRIIERPIRSFTKDLTLVISQLRLFYLSAFEDIPCIKEQIDWRLSRSALLFSTHMTTPTSVQHQQETIFKLKSMFHILPTLDYLKMTQPHLYNNTVCVLCKTSEEDWLHVYTCSSLQSMIKDCLTTSIGHLYVSLAEHIVDSTSFHKEFSALHIWSTSSITRNSTTRTFDLIDFLQGFIPLKLKNFLASNLLPPLNTKSLDKAILRFQSDFLNAFRSKVWRFRNESLKYSQSLHHVSKKSLKTRYRDRDRSLLLSTNRSSSNLDLNNSFPTEVYQIIDNYIDFGSRMLDVF